MSSVRYHGSDRFTIFNSGRDIPWKVARTRLIGNSSFLRIVSPAPQSGVVK